MASCGNITITGGTVTATGGDSAAGIGSGHHGYCDNITISGSVTGTATIMATGGGNAAGIGSGSSASCGNISIKGSVTGTATGGEGSPCDIGAGKDGTCGTVSVDDGTIANTYYTVACTLNVTIYEDNGDTGSYKECSTITISDGTRSVNLSGSDVSFVGNMKKATLNFSLRGPQTGVTLTITGTGGGVGSDFYSATKTVDIVDNGATLDLGTVNLVKQ